MWTPRSRRPPPTNLPAQSRKRFQELSPIAITRESGAIPRDFGLGRGFDYTNLKIFRLRRRSTDFHAILSRVGATVSGQTSPAEKRSAFERCRPWPQRCGHEKHCTAHRSLSGRGRRTGSDRGYRHAKRQRDFRHGEMTPRLTWSTSPGTGCTASGGGRAPGPSGAQTLHSNSSALYTLTCTGAAARRP